MPAFLSAQAGGVRLSVKLQPRASVSAICAPLGAELKIKVTAPPVDAAANEALVKFLAEKLDCPRGLTAKPARRIAIALAAAGGRRHPAGGTGRGG